MALLKRERLGKVEDALSFRQGSDSGEGKRRLKWRIWRINERYQIKSFELKAWFTSTYQGNLPWIWRASSSSASRTSLNPWELPLEDPRGLTGNHTATGTDIGPSSLVHNMWLDMGPEGMRDDVPIDIVDMWQLEKRKSDGWKNAESFKIVPLQQQVSC